MALSETEKRHEKKEKPLTKVVIRRLPPTMTKDQFLEQVSPIPDYNYMYHVKADLSLGENSFSRAYINFVCPNDVYAFKEKFDNYVFVDTKGHEYPAVVEFAPFQKIPKKRGKGKMDPKCNSIEQDTYYLDFVANLNKPVEQMEKPEYTLQLGDRGDDKNKDITTPLLEFIKNRRAQRIKVREVRREEREKRKKEFDRRKEHAGKYYEERKYEEKSPTKGYGKKPYIKPLRNETIKDQETKSNNAEEKSPKGPKEKKEENPIDKQPSEYKFKEKRFEEKKEKKQIKPRFPKKEFSDTREFQPREDYYSRDYRSKQYEDHKKEDTKVFPKKIKKYSEKREERKMEAEQKKLEQLAKEKEMLAQAESGSQKDNSINADKNSEDVPLLEKPSDKELDTGARKKDCDGKGEMGSSRRIRNKDRPAIPLYRPGMLSKRKQPKEKDGSEESLKEEKGEANNE